MDTLGGGAAQESQGFLTAGPCAGEGCQLTRKVCICHQPQLQLATGGAFHRSVSSSRSGQLKGWQTSRVTLAMV